MQLFVPLVAALILNGALAYTVPECAHKEYHTLCQLLRSIHLQNVGTETILRGNDSLKDIRERVSLASGAVLEALNSADQIGLLGALREALQLENDGLSQFELPCESDDSCPNEQLSLMRTISLLVSAIIEAVEIQKQSIKQALEVFQSGSENLTGRSRKMAADVLAVI